MLRALKYGLSGAVVAGVIGGTVAWTAGHDKDVHLVVDGRARAVQTSAATVGQLLASSGFHVDPHDIVAPGPGSALRNGETVVYKRGRLLHLEINGQQRWVWTTASTVAQAMGALGFDSADFVSVSRSRRLPLTPTEIAIRTPKAVTVVHDGRTQQVDTTAATVGQLFTELGIAVHADDKVSRPAGSLLSEGERLVLTRIEHTTKSDTKVVPFATRVHADDSLPLGQTQVVQQGRPGLTRITYAVVYIDGKLVGRTRISADVLRAPVTRVVRRGTALGPDATPQQAQDLARSLLGDYGFGQDQMGCLIELWDHESGWRVTAENPNGGAYGIPQSLPGSKMASAGPNWQTDAETQIRWGLEYIRSRYGDPCGAWSTWQAHGGWY